MSLTNPNDIVTEERLAQFYGEILPYMGGMPDAIFNKFDKSEMYSSTEKVIGCWTNGKPLYQKTLHLTMSDYTGNWPFKYYDLSSLNVDVFIGQPKGYFLYNSKFWTTIPDIEVGNSGFNGDYSACWTLRSGEEIVGRELLLTAQSTIAGRIGDQYITVQYTKSTDAENSFNYADGNDYSTDEQIIGKWITGKPLYQKTVTGTLDTVGKKDVGLPSDVALIVKIEGYAIDTSGWTIYTGTQKDNGLTSQNFTVVGANSPKNQVWFDYGSLLANQTYYLTIKYTKTTD